MADNKNNCTCGCGGYEEEQPTQYLDNDGLKYLLELLHGIMKGTKKAIDDAINALKGRVSVLEEKDEGLTDRVTTLETRADGVDEEIQALVEKTDATNALHESDLDAVRTRIDNVENGTGPLGERVTELEGRADVLEQDALNVYATVEVLRAEVETVTDITGGLRLADDGNGGITFESEVSGAYTLMDDGIGNLNIKFKTA